VDTSSEGLGPA